MGDDHLSVGEREVPTTPDTVGSGVPGRLGRVQALASIGVVAALTAGLLMGLPSPAGAVAGYGDVGETNWYTDAVQWSVRQRNRRHCRALFRAGDSGVAW